MILGVDHLALSCNELSVNLPRVREAGYEVKFIHERLANTATKKPFLSEYKPWHSVAYCQRKDGISLEVTGHAAALSEIPSWYQVLMDQPPAETVPFRAPLPCSPQIWKNTVGCKGAQAGIWKPFQAQIWYGASGNAGGLGSSVRAVLVPVNHLAASAAFWTDGLGCHVLKHGSEGRNSWIHLAWRSPIPRWFLEVILLETDVEMGTSYLDRAGFPCLAFITNDLSRDRLRLIDCGARDASEPSSHRINEKSLRLAIARGPSRELVELIEFEAKLQRSREESAPTAHGA